MLTEASLPLLALIAMVVVIGLLVRDYANSR